MKREGVKAVMLDVDGVLIDGQPHWQTSLEKDLGIAAEALHEHFFAPFWDDIVLGRAALMDHLPAVLQKIAPHVCPEAFLTYWFEKDARVVTSFFPELAFLRSAGIAVHLATNQEHLRAAYLMDHLGLARHIDGMFYSARLGAKKPDLAFFTTIRAAIGLRPDELLLIDDSLPNIEGARNAGWQAVHWTSASSPELLRTLA